MKIFLFIFLFISSSLSLSANNNQAVIDTANLDYSKGLYDKAIDLYQKVINNGYDCAELYYNLGNAYFKTNDIPSAILYYEKAKKLKPNDDDINYNLKVANSKIIDKIDVTPEFFLKKWWRNLYNLYSVNAWAKISVSCVILFSILFLIYFLSKKITIKKISFYLGIVFLIIAISSLIFSYKRYNSFKYQKEAIVFNPSVTVKSSPDENSVDLFVVHQGTKVKIIDKLGNWYEIKITNGSVGWLEDSTVKNI